jgi:hypothetical protein
MHPVHFPNDLASYVLATGEAAAHRLRILNDLQPVVARGEHKRLLELSVAEAGPAFVDAGLITSWDLDRTLLEMRRLAGDGTVLAVMPRMAQVWARKPALPERRAASG